MRSPLLSSALGLALVLAPARGWTAPSPEGPEVQRPSKPGSAQPEPEESEAEEAGPEEPGDRPHGSFDPVDIVAPPSVALVEPEPEPEPELDADEDAEAFDEDLDLDTDAGFDDGYDLLRDSPEAATARRWFAAGIAATTVGAVLLGGAVAFSLTTPCNPSAGNNCFADARDRAAVTLGVPGGLLLAGGIAMTVVGSLQKRRLKASVALAPGQVGFALAGRF